RIVAKGQTDRDPLLELEQDVEAKAGSITDVIGDIADRHGRAARRHDHQPLGTEQLSFRLRSRPGQRREQTCQTEHQRLQPLRTDRLAHASLTLMYAGTLEPRRL